MIWIMLTLGVLLVGSVLGYVLKKRFRKAGLAVFAVTWLLAAVVIVGAAVCWSAPDCEAEDVDYALLLGYALKDGQAQPELIRRLELALDWLNRTEEIPLVVSGGDVRGHGITEAQVMYDWLQSHGADMRRVVMEPEATDTRTNIRYASVLIKSMEREFDTVLILTSEYHQTRARFLAERNGQTACGISCQTPLVAHLIAAVREVYSFANELLEIVMDNLRPVLHG